jgi:hypothetical protein
MVPISIYGLIDPRTDELRYVGQTRRRPLARLTKHIKTARDASPLHVAVWLRGVLLDGARPELVVLEEHTKLDDADEAEAFWIEYFRGIEASPGACSGQGASRFVTSSEGRSKVAGTGCKNARWHNRALQT